MRNGVGMHAACWAVIEAAGVEASIVTTILIRCDGIRAPLLLPLLWLLLVTRTTTATTTSTITLKLVQSGIARDRVYFPQWPRLRIIQNK